MASKTVLVHSGVHKKVVVFSGDLDSLKQAILATFSLQVSPDQLLIQVKSEVLEWKGEWVDASSTDEILDKAVIKAVIEVILNAVTVSSYYIKNRQKVWE